MCPIALFRFLLAAALLPSLIPIIARASSPVDVAKIESQLGCKEVEGSDDSFEGSLILNGYLFGGKGDQKVGTVFWCQRSEDDFLLVFSRGGELFHPQCVPYIQWRRYPLGLKLVTNKQPLSSFVYLDDFRTWEEAYKEGKTRLSALRKGPANVLTSGPFVQDGTSFENYFYCYKGRWMIKQRD